MTAPDPITFKPVWDDPDPRFLRATLPPAPALPLDEVSKPRIAQWITEAAEAKSAPPDYVFAALLAVAGAVIGNSRWVSPWTGWAEPPVVWAMLIGSPSAGKSPAIDAVLNPLHKVEGRMRKAVEAEFDAWTEKSEVAEVIEQTWKDEVKSAIKKGEARPARPVGCDPGPQPNFPRLVVNDGTIERLGAILAAQPRGTLQLRDELAGWLENMNRYNGASDRPFWLEAYGGRSFTVERVGRAGKVEHLTIGVLGGIQPDRLKSLLFKSDDDGLLARFLPIFPDPTPPRRPGSWSLEALMEGALADLVKLDLVVDVHGMPQPRVLSFSDAARNLMDEFRLAVRGWEDRAEGLMLSFLGKLPGLAARLSLILAYLDWVTECGPEPEEISMEHFGRAAHLVEAYVLPMARRAYAGASAPAPERAARQLVAIIQENCWEQFSSREVTRLDRKGLNTAEKLNPALKLLEDGDCIRAVEIPTSPRGGRPQRLFTVNPALHEKAE